MKTKKEEMAARPAYKRYATQFKGQALERADRDGIPKVAQDLGIAEATLYAWRAKRRQTGQPFEDQKLQQAEMARLKRENARLEEEVAFLIPTGGTRKGGGALRETAQVDCMDAGGGATQEQLPRSAP